MRNPALLVLDRTDELSHQVKRVVAHMHPRPDVVWCNGFEAIESLTADAGPFDVLVAGPMVADDDGFRKLRQLREQAPDMRLILAVDRWRSASLRDTVRTGALDILRLPVDDAKLHEAVEEALKIGTSALSSVVEEPARRNGQGTVIAVLSATGGCGKTFLATNLAYYLQSHFQMRTCLIDLDLQFGELSTALRLKPRSTIHDLVSDDDVDQEDLGDLGDRLEDHLVHHDSGIHLLAAPEEPAQADAVGAEDVIRIIEAARARFDYVVIDTPAALSEPVLAILDQADQLFALATLDLPSVRNLGILMATLKKLTVPTDRVKLMLNKVEPDVGIDVAGVSSYFPQGFSIVVPYGREVNRSLNMGQPVLAYAPHGQVSKSLDAGLLRALGLGGGTNGVVAGRAPDPSGLRRWFGRRQTKSA